MKKIKELNEKTRMGNIELYSNREAIIEGCECVVDYSAEFIKLNLGSTDIKICGCGLVIESYIYGQIDIKGEIVSIEFMN